MKTELEYLKAALIDWEKPISESEENGTFIGFCHYFNNIQKINLLRGNFKRILPNLYKESPYPKNVYHYKEYGDHPTGRAQRVRALKNAIAKLEKA